MTPPDHDRPPGLTSASMVSTEALTRLKTAALALMAASKIDDAFDTILRSAIEGLGAVAAGVVLVDDDTQTLVLVAGRNLPDTTVASFPLPLSTHVPITDAATSGIPLWIESAGERDRWYPLLEDDERSAPSQGLLPLQRRGRTIGVLGLTFDGTRAVGEIERSYCTVLAGLCALALADFGADDGEERDRSAR